MTSSFSRSLRALGNDHFRGSTIGILVVAGLLAAWSAWFFLAQITLYEVSAMARLELDRAAHPIESPVAGRVVKSGLTLDREVAAGDLVVELGAESEQLELEEQLSRLAALGPQLDAIRNEITAQTDALEGGREAMRAGLEEARAKFREADVAASLAEQEVERLSRLNAEGLLSEAELGRARAEAEGRRAAAESVRLALERLESEKQVASHDRQARVEQLRRERARIEGEIATGKAVVNRLENEIDKRSIRAPAAGRLVEAATIEAGAFVNAGDRLGVVLGAGKLKAVVDYSPAALGRIRPGQLAKLRLEGFPSAQYGSLAATVTNVSSELRDGRVRVELDVHPESNTRLPLQHGLPGAAEIRIEQVSPAVLVLRAAGKLMARPPDMEQ